jgi:uncharacterized membrane protein YgcG
VSGREGLAAGLRVSDTRVVLALLAERVEMRVLLPLIMAMLLGNTALAADDFGVHSGSQHVYDRAGILSAQDKSTLEQKASELQRAGAPTVVYVRVKDSTLAQAKQEARDLMDAWNVESSANAHDGLVVMVDLKPDDTQHGQLGLFAGQSLNALTSDELDRIAADAMSPALRQGELGRALGIGLDAVRMDVQRGASSHPGRLVHLPVRWAGLALAACSL